MRSAATRSSSSRSCPALSCSSADADPAVATVPRAELEKAGDDHPRPAVNGTTISRWRAPVRLGSTARRRADRGEARLAAAQPAGDADRAARARVRRRRRSSPACSASTSRAGSRGRCWRSPRAADEVAGGNYGVEVPQPRGRTRSPSVGALRRHGGEARRAEQLSRNFLMTSRTSCGRR